MAPISFCETYRAPNEIEYLSDALANGLHSVDGPYSRRARTELKAICGGGDVYLTTSGSAALELANLIIGIGPGDEVIVPSFTFSSVANAVVLRGGTPVFVDVEPSTLNISAQTIAPAITPRTKAILVVHYAGVVADMLPIMALARQHNLRVVEDAAHAIGASRDGRMAGSFGDLAAFSFHYTKNVSCGEGGCLVLNAPELKDRTDIAFEKGTNRRAFIDGLVDKYSWVDRGSSFTMSELNAAVLAAQLEALPEINGSRMELWRHYLAQVPKLLPAHLAQFPTPPDGTRHNAHLFYVILETAALRSDFIAFMARRRITTPFHYVPLHNAPASRAFGRSVGDLSACNAAGARLVRLPLHPGLGEKIELVLAAIAEWAADADRLAD